MIQMAEILLAEWIIAMFSIGWFPDELVREFVT